MKFLTIAMLLTVCTAVSAQEKEMFEKAKQQRLSNIDKRMSYLQELKSCVSSASSREGMKSCNEAHKSKLSSLKESNESFREGMKEEWKAKKENRKKR